MASELLKRSEVREEDTWKTSDMYENTGAWETELKEISALVDKAAAFEGKAAENADNLLAVLETMATAGEKIEKEGVHVLTIEAFDSAGNKGEAKWQKL